VLYSLRQLYKRFDYMHPVRLCVLSNASLIAVTWQLLRLFTTVVLLEWTSVFCNLLHFGTFAKDGLGMPSVEHFAEVGAAHTACCDLYHRRLRLVAALRVDFNSQVMGYLSRIMFVLCLMLLAKGSSLLLRCWWLLHSSRLPFAFCRLDHHAWRAVAEAAHRGIGACFLGGVLPTASLIAGCCLRHCLHRRADLGVRRSVVAGLLLGTFHRSLHRWLSCFS
jgi:hypothetical protein